MPILNYSTKVDTTKTIMEIQKMLGSHGATKITLDYNVEGNPIALTFCIPFNGAKMAFLLPCNFDSILILMNRDKKVPKSLRTSIQASRVGWRIVKDWVEAQLAIVDVRMADITEVFLPYAITQEGNTLYQYIQKKDQLLLFE